jgi:transcriptional regulator with XRE-family HTH domain
MKRAAKMKNKTVNTAWLLSLLKAQNLSQRELAKRMGIEQAAFFHLLRGRRRLQLEEAAQLARELHTPIQDLLEAFGIDLDLRAGGATGPERSNLIAVSGWLDRDLLAHFGEEGLRGRREVVGLAGERDAQVLRCQTAGSEFEGLDGALVYFRAGTAAKGKTASTSVSDLVGRLVLAKRGDSPVQRLRALRRGYSPGCYHLCGLNGQILEEDVFLESASPVLEIKFPKQ